MIIFNSLGSNYSLGEVLLVLKELIWPNQHSKKQLQQLLGESFGGRAELLFNGRDAIEYCLEAFGVQQGDVVLTQALSCFSIEEAINRTGAKAVYFDLAPNKPFVTLQQVKTAYQRAKQSKAVILQHGLGYPDDLEAIAKFCQEKKIILIEDLAQGVGAKTHTGQKIGGRGDAIILSFGRDKILDGISGGAVVFTNSPRFQPMSLTIPDWFELKSDWRNKKLVLKMLFYPALTLLIRWSYPLGLGKVLHQVAVRLGLMQSAMISPHQNYQSYPAYFAFLVLKRWKELKQQLADRQQIALIYQQQLSKINCVNLITDEPLIKRSSNLRFPIILESKQHLNSLLAYLKTKNIHLSDRWYRAPVDGDNQSFSSNYQLGDCPQAEWLSERIINLPTHRLIKNKQAQAIILAIAQWCATQNKS